MARYWQCLIRGAGARLSNGLTVALGTERSTTMAAIIGHWDTRRSTTSARAALIRLVGCLVFVGCIACGGCSAAQVREAFTSRPQTVEPVYLDNVRRSIKRRDLSSYACLDRKAVMCTCDSRASARCDCACTGADFGTFLSGL